MITLSRRFAPWVLPCMMAAPMFAGACESLASLKLPDTTITMAQVVGAGAFSSSSRRRGNRVPGSSRVLPGGRDAQAIERFGY